MKIRQIDNDVLVCLERGDKIPDALIKAVKDTGIQAAVVSGIGALQSVELGYFDINKKEYIKKTFEESYELVSLTGNLGWVDKEPFLHLHAAISGPDMTLLGGHLFSGVVSVTGEIILKSVSTRIERTDDAFSGLKLWNL